MPKVAEFFAEQAKVRQHSEPKRHAMTLKRLTVAFLCFFLTLPALADQEPGLATFIELQKTVVQLSETIKPSVVHIEVHARRGNVRRKGMGSGLIISADGRIVTNHHVVDRAERITVRLDDKSQYEAEVLRQDKQTDLALLKIKPKSSLPAAHLANSDSVSVGQWVLAVGNPYGFDRTVSFGIVSGKGRYIPDINNEVQLLNDFIQTDALIDPGSSGGPLINLKGEVVGINSVGIGRGQGFTIPANVVKEVITRKKVEGRIERGWLGVILQPFPRALAKYYGDAGLRGILVADVQSGSPADRHGLLSGDVITNFNGNDLAAEQDEEISKFTQMVTSVAPNTPVQVEVFRNGGRRNLEVTLGTQPNVDPREVDTNLGMLVQEITQRAILEHRLDDDQGVIVSFLSRGEVAHEAGLELADVITHVDGKQVDDLESFEKMLKTLDRNKNHLLTVLRGRTKRYALLELNAPHLKGD